MSELPTGTVTFVFTARCWPQCQSLRPLLPCIFREGGDKRRAHAEQSRAACHPAR
jgi:hypothetical protein